MRRSAGVGPAEMIPDRRGDIFARPSPDSAVRSKPQATKGWAADVSLNAEIREVAWNVRIRVIIRDVAMPCNVPFVTLHSPTPTTHGENGLHWSSA